MSKAIKGTGGLPGHVAGEPRCPEHSEGISGQGFGVGASGLVSDGPDLVRSPVSEPEGVAVARQRIS